MRAYSTLIAVLLLLFFLGIITAGLSFMSIHETRSEWYRVASHSPELYAQSCVEEVLRRLRDNAAFSGGFIALSEQVSCDSTITDDNSQKIINVQVSQEDFHSSLTARVEVIIDGMAHNFRVMDWKLNSQ